MLMTQRLSSRAGGRALTGGRGIARRRVSCSAATQPDGTYFGGKGVHAEGSVEARDTDSEGGKVGSGVRKDYQAVNMQVVYLQQRDRRNAGKHFWKI